MPSMDTGQWVGALVLLLHSTSASALAVVILIFFSLANAHCSTGRWESFAQAILNATNLEPNTTPRFLLGGFSASANFVKNPGPFSPQSVFDQGILQSKYGQYIDTYVILIFVPSLLCASLIICSSFYSTSPSPSSGDSVWPDTTFILTLKVLSTPLSKLCLRHREGPISADWFLHVQSDHQK